MAVFCSSVIRGSNDISNYYVELHVFTQQSSKPVAQITFEASSLDVTL